jgi:AraC-like DNA-binding protein
LTAWQLSKAKGFMLGRLSDRLSIGDVASDLALSRSYFVRSFTNTMGVAPYSWLVEQRINEARELLTGTTIPLAQIALECGFTDQSHFTNAFNRRVGTTPSKWRKAEGSKHLHIAWGHQDGEGHWRKAARDLNQKGE